MIKNILPTYTTTIPSTGVKVEYTPYNNKQEKVLLMAVEDGDVDVITATTKKLIESCFINIDVDKLTTFDIDFLFLQLRIQSVSDKSELYFRSMQCLKEENIKNNDGECDKTIKLTIDLSQIKVEQYNEETEEFSEYQPQTTKNTRNLIEISKSVGVTMKYPGFVEQEKFNKLELQNEDELIKLCITSVYDEESVVTQEEFSKTDLDEFYNSLIPRQKVGLQKFIRNVPSVRYETEFVCKECGFREPLKFESLESFFG